VGLILAPIISQPLAQTAIIIAISGFLIDLDHIIYYIPKGFKNWKKDFKNKSPHFYIFHTLEFIILIGIVCFYYNFMFLVWIGFLIHLATDALTYLYNYKTNLFWLKYWSFFSYFKLKTNL
jgi:hypothetical protein